jgi:uncharacterized membrane protein
MRSGETDREISADEEAVSQAEDPLLAAIEGRYSLSIEGVLSEARKLAEGYKFKLNIAAAIYSLIVIAMALLVGGLGALTDNSIFIAIVGELIYAWITLPVAMGLFAISLDRVAGGEVSNDRLFLFFPQATRLLVTTVLMTLLIFVGYVLLIIPGLYLSVAYLFVLPLLVQRELGMLDALEVSRKAITHRWFTVLGILLVLALINVIGAIPLGIGLIWTIPWTMLAMGVMYQRIFVGDSWQ